ncbi:MAG TPA: trypsin-like peptidase domain-containing protein [Nocardioidaceae bacterium]|nr:trypsin-like peptidase domain-containing protein [Nocardioidaceae bacterium]
MTNEQDRPFDPDSEPTEVLGAPDEPGAAPPAEPRTEDTAQLWPQPAPTYQQQPPASPYSYGQPPPQQPQQPQQTQPYGYPEYQPAHEPEQLPQQTEAAPRARVPGWLWPVVAATALVVGTIGGAIGGTIVAGDDDTGFFETTDNGSDDPDDLPTSEAPLPEGNASIAAVAAKVLPSTVQVNANGGSGDGTGATGSGFVVDDKGHVITNNHVIAGATGDNELEVVDQAGRSHKARIVGRSTVYDIAVLSITDYEGLVPAALGASRAMRIGETVVAIGSPLGLSSTVTAGIVSAVERPVTTSGESGDSSYINAVQTDAAINPGNSGGPLVNLRGQVIGVNSAIATTGGIGGEQSGNIGVGFAIPIEQVRVTAEQILATGEAQYPIIGANVNTVPDKSGAHIVDVNAGAPAEAAGLRKNDYVVAVDGKPVQDSIGLIVAIRSHQPGETVTLTILRAGAQRDVEITLDAQSDKPTED